MNSRLLKHVSGIHTKVDTVAQFEQLNGAAEIFNGDKGAHKLQKSFLGSLNDESNRLLRHVTAICNEGNKGVEVKLLKSAKLLTVDKGGAQDELSLISAAEIVIGDKGAVELLKFTAEVYMKRKGIPYTKWNRPNNPYGREASAVFACNRNNGEKGCKFCRDGNKCSLDDKDPKQQPKFRNLRILRTISVINTNFCIVQGLRLTAFLASSVATNFSGLISAPANLIEEFCEVVELEKSC